MKQVNMVWIKLFLILSITSLNFQVLADEEVENAEPGDQLPQITYRAVEFKYDKDNQIQKWRRPPEVSYILVSACGGGAGGAMGYENESTKSAAGAGGGSSKWETVFLGPLTEDTYEIVVGKGGTPGGYNRATDNHQSPSHGGLSEFKGERFNFAVPGGEHNFIQHITGEVGTKGVASMIGAGGAGGGKNGKGLPGGHCAGGGGSGLRTIGALSGGGGGHGLVIVQPLPDFERMIKLFESMSGEKFNESSNSEEIPVIEAEPVH